MEITFSGAGGGSAQAQTPEQYGHEKRRAIKELAAINEMDIRTHASLGIMGLAGTDQQGNFSSEYRKMAVDEIKRAINFASEIQGGSVVVHSGEFHRPISEMPEARTEQGYLFKQYEKEAEEAVVGVVDERTGQVHKVRKNQEVARPVWNAAEKDEEITLTREWADEYGTVHNSGTRITVKKDQYTDYEGNPVSLKERVPKFDKEKHIFVVKKMNWGNFEDEANEQTEDAKKFWRHNRNNEEALRGSDYARYYFDENNKIIKDENKIKIRPEEANIRATLATNAANAKGWAIYHSEHFQEYVDSVKKLRKAKEFYEKLEAATDPEERWKLQREADSVLRGLGGIIPGEYKLTSEIIGEHLRNVQANIDREKESASSQLAQAQDAEESMKHMVSAERYALEQSHRSYADAGMHAFLKTQKMKEEYEERKKEGKALGEVRPIFIAVENLFPEAYGGHPEEVKELVLKSREKMADMLYQQHRAKSKEEAEKIAADHIKMTFDTNHMFMWRKYWQDDVSKSSKENDEGFEKWYLDQVKMLAEAKIIGNVHLVDGFGYQDDHLSAGEGNVPIKKVIDILKKSGYDDKIIVEAGAEATVGLGHFEGVAKAWQLLNGTVYGKVGAAGGAREHGGKWGSIQYSYFGQNTPPYYVFGSYVPSEDWTLWSQVPFE
jgi:sugar phosphate isomerase/epimerase